MIRRPPRSTLDRSSAASDVYKRQIQTAYYQQAKNPSLPEILQGCAREIGLNEEVFIEDLRSPAIESELQHQLQRARSMDGYSYPSLRLVHNNTCLLYTSPSPRDRTRSRMPSSA